MPYQGNINKGQENCGLQAIFLADQVIPKRFTLLAVILAWGVLVQDNRRFICYGQLSMMLLLPIPSFAVGAMDWPG